MFSLFSLSSVIVAVALAKSTFAAVAFTSPTASIGFTGGQPANIQWMDDGNAPPLTAYGPCNLSIFAGNAAQQSSILLVTSGIDPSNPTSFSFTPDPSIGPNSDQYFIRLESLTNKDPSNPLLPLLAFSHTFTMSGMTGTFSSQVQSEIDGQSTAPIGGSAPPAPAPTPSAAPNATPSPSVVGSTVKPSVAASNSLPKTSAGSGSATAKAASASGKSAAVPNFVASHNLWLGVVTGVVGAFMGATLL